MTTLILRRWTSVGFFILCAFPVSAMPIEWTRMTGQWPVETAPIVLDVDGDGKNEIFAVNRGGQIMLWRSDASAVGSGQDGTVTQLPQGQWTTTPTVVSSSNKRHYLFCSTEGLVVCLDAQFQLRWKYQLPGHTTWGRAFPAVLATATGTLDCFGDHSGTVTCLREDGSVSWSVKLGNGMCQAPLQRLTRPSHDSEILVSVGNVLYCLDSGGRIVWERDLHGQILTLPEILDDDSKGLIVCAAGSGSLFGLNLNGKVRWEVPLGDSIDTSITFLPRHSEPPLILCTGLWGNLHAVSPDGQRVWTHYYRAKGRGVPLIMDANGDGTSEILVATYAQHLYAFDESGNIVDDVRLNGIINPSLMPISEAGRTDVLATTASLLLYRLRPGLPTSPYGDTGKPDGIHMTTREPNGEAPHMRVENPNGAWIRVNLAMQNGRGWRRVAGVVTGRSLFELAYPVSFDYHTWTCQAVARDVRGNVLAREEWTSPIPANTAETAGNAVAAWATAAYGSFQEDLFPVYSGDMEINPLYLGETDQASFIVTSRRELTVRATLAVGPLKTEAGTEFLGNIVLRQVVPTATENGEWAADALVSLGRDNVVTIPPKHTVKIWLSANTGGTKPGLYHGTVTILPLVPGTHSIELSLTINVLPLAIPEKFPLTLCTWDYVPNRWFPQNTGAVLDDMRDHGVNVYPRSSAVPPATVGKEGKLQIDWTNLDIELDRLRGRGQILFHLGVPTINFEASVSEDARRLMQVNFLQTLRGHLLAKGFDYEDYAFYPVDEPGLSYGQSVDALVQAGALLRQADPNFRIYTDPVPSLSWTDFERIEPYIDIWCPNMRLVSGLLAQDPRMKRILEGGDTVWSYECVSQVKSLSPLRYNRANAWRAKYFGLKGIGFWTHSTSQQDPWIPRSDDQGTDEYALVYPGPTPVPSVRWEAVRDGLEDVAAIQLLEERIAAGNKARTRPEILVEAENELRTAFADVLELSDAAFVESRDYLKKGDRRIWHTDTDIELFRHHRAEIARLTTALTEPAGSTTE
ncbi:MAG: PQQ-binding-like beta-propeller repeat protein [Candidatus Hydrogenedentes bacterium]|nr:PQQ-binding-like beta-propeller repeat protein [Candidatus Hydrogenedentota bacterium]